jgi:hypothetical protein
MEKSRKKKFMQTIDDMLRKKRITKAKEVYTARSPSIKRPMERVSGPVLPALPDGHIGTASVFYTKDKKRKVTKARN